MKRNSQIHLWLETELKELLEKQAQDAKLSINELCRQKLRENDRLTKIEIVLDRIEKRLNIKLNSNRR